MWSRSISSGRNRAAGLAALAVILAAGPVRAQDAGRPADTLRYPFVAALSRSTDERRVYFCAGALVAPQWILTAAHCFYSPERQRIDEADLWAEVGGSRLGEVPEAGQVRIAQIVIHPDYDPVSQADDIALVRLERIAGPLIADVADEARSRPVKGALAVTVLGFGSFYEGRLAATARLGNGAPAAQLSDRLRQAGVSLEDCAPPDGPRLCATANSSDSCVGDSGAPLMADLGGGRDWLIGIVSAGTGCAAERPVTVYTRVSAYARWIAQVIAGR